MEHHEKCPNCGRSLAENEVYCYFCETDMSRFEKKTPEMKFLGNPKIKKFLSNKKQHGKKQE